MSRFDACLLHILAFEGGFTDNHVDHGGATNKGITQATYNAFNAMQGRTLEQVQDITDDEVAAIYKAEYWDKCKCSDLHVPLDLVLFDSAVQHGVKRASKWLQHAIGVIADGAIGNETLFAVNRIVLDRRLDALIDSCLAARTAFYASIISNDPSQKIFSKGWKSRMDKLTSSVKGS